eukprot:14333_1
MSYECVGLQIDTSSYLMFLDITGYKAAFGPTTSLTGRSSSILGSHGLYAAEFVSLTTYFTCAAAFACANTTITMTATASTGRQVLCGGTASCAYSTIIQGDINGINKLYCYADQSCAYSHLIGFTAVIAQGAYSLYNANVTSDAVDLYGDRAGDGATIYCDRSCDIRCYGYNSCQNMYVDISTCKQRCNIQLMDGGTGIAPIHDISLLVPNSHIPPLFDALFTASKNEASCNTDPSGRVYDDTEEFGWWTTTEDIVISTDAVLCCRGSLSCYWKQRMYYVGVTNQSIICGGDRSCKGVQKYIDSNDGKVYCDGRLSCEYPTIQNSYILHCGGLQSCSSTFGRNNPPKINGVRHLICSGSESCSNDKYFREYPITSNGRDLEAYFSGYLSGGNAVITCGAGDSCTIVCTGYASCGNVTVNCYGICDIQCEALSGCPVVTTLAPIPTAVATTNPSQSPTNPSTNPSAMPTANPSESTNPSESPSAYPSLLPSLNPSTSPSLPSVDPSLAPSHGPSESPSAYPSLLASINPSTSPSLPSVDPSLAPSYDPSANPSESPSAYPSLLSSINPSINPSFMTSSNEWMEVYTISVVLNDCTETECVITQDKINDIITAQLDDNVQLLSTEIVDYNIIISVATTTPIELDKDVIVSGLEAEYGDVDVTITDENDSDDRHDVDDDRHDANYTIPVGASVVFGVIVFVLLYMYCKRAKRVKVNESMIGNGSSNDETGQIETDLASTDRPVSSTQDGHVSHALSMVQQPAQHVEDVNLPDECETDDMEDECEDDDSNSEALYGGNKTKGDETAGANATAKAGANVTEDGANAISQSQHMLGISNKVNEDNDSNVEELYDDGNKTTTKTKGDGTAGANATAKGGANATDDGANAISQSQHMLGISNKVNEDNDSNVEELYDDGNKTTTKTKGDGTAGANATATAKGGANATDDGANAISQSEDMLGISNKLNDDSVNACEDVYQNEGAKQQKSTFGV